MTGLEREKERGRYQRRKNAVLLQKRLHYANNRGMMLERNRKWCSENKAKLKLLKRAWRKRDAEKIRLRNLDYMRRNKSKVAAWNKAWHIKNPARVALYDKRRRALELNAPTDDAAVLEFLSWIKNQDYVTCTYCGCYITGSAVEIDHIIPLTRGGYHHPHNFALSCKSCNTSKGNRLLAEWEFCPQILRNQ